MTAVIGAFGVLAAPVAASGATIDTNTIVSGAVQNGDGPAPGATVTVEIWPNSTVADAVPDGGILPTINLGPVPVASDTTYAVDADPATISADYRDPAAGTIDMEVDIHFNGAITSWNTSVLPGTGGAAWTSTFGTAAPPNIAFVLGASPAVDEIGNDPAQSVDESGNVIGGAHTMSSVSQAAGPDFSTCSPQWKATSTTTTGKDHIIDAYGWSGAQVTESQQIGSTHQLGVAVSTSGTFFSGEGGATRSINAGIGITVPVTHTLSSTYSEAFYNKVSYRKWQKQVDCGAGLKILSTEWRPNAVVVVLDRDAGFSHSISPHHYGGGCTTLFPGDNFSRHSGKAIVFSAGVTLTGVFKAIGINVTLSAENDYSTNAVESWHVTQKSSLCYSNSGGEAFSTRFDVEPPV